MLNLIVAVSKNKVIGVSGKLPWHILEDLKFFKEKTNGNVIIMGRKTFDSIGRILPNRKHWILSSQKESIINKDKNPNVKVFNSLENIISELNKRKVDGYVIGRGEIYNLFLPYVSIAYVTEVDLEILNGDTFFHLPNYFKEIKRTDCSSKDNLKFSFVTYKNYKL